MGAHGDLTLVTHSRGLPWFFLLILKFSQIISHVCVTRHRSRSCHPRQTSWSGQPPWKWFLSRIPYNDHLRSWCSSPNSSKVFALYDCLHDRVHSNLPNRDALRERYQDRDLHHHADLCRWRESVHASSYSTQLHHHRPGLRCLCWEANLDHQLQARLVQDQTAHQVRLQRLSAPAQRVPRARRIPQRPHISLPTRALAAMSTWLLSFLAPLSDSQPFVSRLNLYMVLRVLCIASVESRDISLQLPIFIM